jgi:F0F1-type ATP synthase assembly protein I
VSGALSATTGGLGGFLLVFGFLFLLISSAVVGAIMGYSQDTTVPTVLMELLGILLASVGAGLLMFALLSRRSKAEETPAADSQ